MSLRLNELAAAARVAGGAPQQAEALPLRRGHVRVGIVGVPKVKVRIVTKVRGHEKVRWRRRGITARRRRRVDDDDYG